MSTGEDGRRLHNATHRDANRLFFLASNRGLERQSTDQLLSRIELLLRGRVVRLERENLRHVLGVSGHFRSRECRKMRRTCLRSTIAAFGLRMAKLAMALR